MPPSKRLKLSDKAHLPFRVENKERRQALNVKRKRALDILRREERFGRKKQEAKNPRLREDRLKRNVPATLDGKRQWDDVENGEDDGLGLSIDLERIKRQRVEEQSVADEAENASDDNHDSDDDKDSMLDEVSDKEEIANDAGYDSGKEGNDLFPTEDQIQHSIKRAASPSRSTTSTNLNLAPEALAAKFPTLFDTTASAAPKILITSSINSTLHAQAEILTTLFPNSRYIRRTAHSHGHKFSVREISSFAAHRGFTSLVVLEESMQSKTPSGLTIVHLPQGPTFHFSISNWLDGRSLPGHGNPTAHTPELILNNFRTPLGLLTAHLFQTLFPAQPTLAGRQVVTLHNQRDYIFLRRHRYVFREKRETEKSVTGNDGKDVKGVEQIRAGLQELGPRFTLKLRRVDKGIQRSSGQEWEWKGKMEKTRTKFQL